MLISTYLVLDILLPAFGETAWSVVTECSVILAPKVSFNLLVDLMVMHIPATYYVFFTPLLIFTVGLWKVEGKQNFTFPFHTTLLLFSKDLRGNTVK